MRECLKRLCEAFGVGGIGNIADVITEYVRPFADEVRKDAMGNVVAVQYAANHDAPTLLLEAHMDEIGFVVTHVDDAGFLHVSPCGGVDARVLSAAPVVVLANEPLDGVFCSTPPHLALKDNEIPAVTDTGIDVGLSAEEARMRVPVGTRVAFKPNFRMIGNDCVCVKSLDNRAGCAAVIEAFRRLHGQPLPCHVAAVFAVQEEVGGAGAVTSAFCVQPKLAIVTDVSFASTPDAPVHECGELGKGPMLGVAPSLDRSLIDLIDELANKHDIPLQWEVMGGRTGTDADHIQISKNGVKTALLSIPQRYMHTPAEMVCVRDVEQVAVLMELAAKEVALVC